MEKYLRENNVCIHVELSMRGVLTSAPCAHTLLSIQFATVKHALSEHVMIRCFCEETFVHVCLCVMHTSLRSGFIVRVELETLSYFFVYF